MTTQTMTTKHTRGKNLTLPLLSLSRTPHIFVEVCGEIEHCHMPGFARSKDECVDLLDVVDIDTGEQHRLIVLAVIKSTLDKLGGELIGRKFEMVLEESIGDEDYRRVSIYELD